MTTRVTTPDILGDIMTGATAAVVAPTTTVPLAAIVNDGGTQMRAGMDAATITEYEEAIKGADGWPFPPVVVFHDGEKYWLADGFHRVNAAHRSGKHTAIPAEVKAGTRRDAILYAAGANASHGLRRTNGDKRRAVEVLLKDVEWSQWSNVEIAKRCQVAESSVRNIRAELERTSQIAKSVVRTGADGRVYNTQNIGSNRPTRLFVGDLKGLVSKWMGQHWQYAWPDNPSHTNGEFWQQLTAWMHENVRETWQEGDLKEAIKALHYQSTAPAASRPAATPAAQQYMAVWQLEGVVRDVFKEVYGGQELPFAIRDMKQGAQQRTGRFWLLCAKTINADNWRHSDLAQAVHNVAEHFAQQRVAAGPGGTMPKYTVEELRGMVRACAVETGMTPAGEQTPFWSNLQTWMNQHAGNTLWSVSDLRAALDQVIRQNAKDAPIVAADDLHAGAGRTPPPAMSVAELVEDLDGYLTGIPAAEIDAAARGANNRALQTAQTCLSDFTYCQADLYRALQRLALQRGAAATPPAEPVVNGDRPLPTWAAAPVAKPARHPQHDELFEFSELFKLATKEVRKWAHMTGEHTEILEAERGLRHLVERTDAILTGFTHATE